MPLELEPLQKPHPPIYYGAHSPDSAERAARKGLNIINNDVPATTRACIERYREVWREVFGAAAPPPKMGMVRFIVVADTRRHGARGRAARLCEMAAQLQLSVPPARHLAADRRAAAGFRRARCVRARRRRHAGHGARLLAPQLAESGSNYLVGQFAFGDLTLDEMLNSVALFARDVMPALRAQHAAAHKTVEPAHGP